MAWKNESRRHALASKGIRTGTKGKPMFLGSRAIGESEEEQIEREAQWKEDHACPICEEFRCDGYCNEREMKKIAESEEMDSKSIKVKLYGEWREFPSMQIAKKELRDLMYHSEGAEQSRYTRVYLQLQDDMTVANDEWDEW